MKSMRIDPLVYGRNWGLFFAWGVAFTLLGILAISTATFATLVSVVLLGMFIFLGGAILLIDTFTFWWRRKGVGFFVHLLMSILYLGVGILLIKQPVSASISLTLLLGIFYLIIGTFRLFYFWSLRAPRWGWGFLNAFLTLLLGMLILANWPASGLYIIGLFVGIDLLFCGLAYIMAAISSRKHY